MSLPKPPFDGAPLPFDGTLDEPTLADYAALGWSPVDIRTAESSLETCKLILLGLRLGTVSLDKAQLEALELEIRVNGGFSAKVADSSTKGPQKRELPKDEIDVLARIPASDAFNREEKLRKGTKGEKDPLLKVKPALKPAKRSAKKGEKAGKSGGSTVSQPEPQGPASPAQAFESAVVTELLGGPKPPDFPLE